MSHSRSKDPNSTTDIFAALGGCCEVVAGIASVGESIAANEAHSKGNHQDAANHYKAAANLSHLSGDHESEYLFRRNADNEVDGHRNECKIM